MEGPLSRVIQVHPREAPRVGRRRRDLSATPGPSHGGLPRGYGSRPPVCFTWLRTGAVVRERLVETDDTAAAVASHVSLLWVCRSLPKSARETALRITQTPRVRKILHQVGSPRRKRGADHGVGPTSSRSRPRRSGRRSRRTPPGATPRPCIPRSRRFRSGGRGR